MEKTNLLRNIFVILAIVGLGFLVIPYFLPDSLTQSTLVNSYPLTVSDQSANEVNSSYTVGFNLQSGDVCNVILANTFNHNASQTAVIEMCFVEQSVYQDAFINGYDPDGDVEVTGNWIDFRRVEIKYPNPTSSVYDDNYAIAEGVTVHLEFMGDDDGSDIYSRPGDYVLIVWAYTSGAATPTTSIGITVSINTHGRTVSTIMTWIGIIALLAAAIIGIAYLILIRKR
ncbi:MAG: hypothetical protein ACFFBP_11695 [Promethearchaeota archaeon]